MMRLNPAKILLSLLLAAVPIRAAEVPQLLADVNQTLPSPDALAVPEPSGFLALGGRMVFAMQGLSRAGMGGEWALWSTDGTASGTRIISSTICPYYCQRITALGTWHGLALFRSSSALVREEIWRTDGTAAGTFPLARPFANGSSGVEVTLHALENSFFLVLCDTPDFPFDCVLFRSDGTPEGTAPVAAAGSPPPTQPHSLAVWRDRLVFIAGTGAETGLWSTDGTPEGTLRLADVREGLDAVAPVVPTPSRIFFGSGDTGQDLWVTDGTPGNARRLAGFDPVSPEGSGTPDINSLTAIGDEALFITFRSGHGEEIWRSDGTESGTRPVFELPPSQTWSVPERLPGNRWLFTASPGDHGDMRTLWTADDDFTHAAPLTGCGGGACPIFEQSLSPTLPKLFVGGDDAHGDEVWITDGTAAGTRLLADVCPGPCSGFREGDEEVLGSAAGRTWFLASPHDGNEEAADDELWTTDGTPGGTHKVAGHVVSSLGFFGDLTFFGLGGQGREASELWTTDGSPASNRRVEVLQRFAPGSFPEILPTASGTLFRVDDGTHLALWRSDGTPAGTRPLAVLPGFQGFSRELSPVGGLRFFTAGDGERRELWRTDGTAAGTLSIARLPLGSDIDLSAAWRGRLLFQIAGKTCAFWSSDGSPGGTREILPQLPGRRCPTALRATGDKFLFVARVQKKGGFVPQIFVSDGTAAGTLQISQIHFSRQPLFEDSPATAGGITFFRILLPKSSDTQVWRTDGTAAGTYLLFSQVQPASLFGFRSSLYYLASPDLDTTNVLYRLPASGGEPIPLAEVGTSFGFPLPAAELTPVGDRLFFVAEDGEGVELWVTDGTAAGTRRVTSPSPRSIVPSGLVAAGNRVFFTADDVEHGRELWESDGTPEGTRLVFDLNPGGFSSNPTDLVVSGGNLFFSADDGETGVEPWVLRLEP